MYSTLPPACTSSYGLIAASPTKMSFQSGPYLCSRSARGDAVEAPARVVAPDVVVDAVVEIESTRDGGTRSSPPRRVPRTAATCGSIEPPTSRNSSTLTRLRRSGTRCRSSQPALLAVPSIVPSRSSSSGTPSRAKRRSLRSATLMLRVLSSTSPSRLRKLRSSQTLTALRLPLPGLADADAFRVVAVGAERTGAAGADPLRAARRGAPSAPRGACAASPSACRSRPAPRPSPFPRA